MRNKKRNRKKADVMFSLVFVVILVVIMVLNLLAPNKEVSVDENRRLAGRPRFSADSLLSGEYEKYLSDQFAGREVLRNARVVLNRLGGSKEENGVLIGKNGQLMEKLLVPDQEVLGNNLDAIVDFAEKNQKMPVYMMLVPDAANVLNKDLPLLYTAPDQKRMIAQVKRELDTHVTWIDVESVLNKHTDDTIYYKTDKHWTSAGAYYVFQAAAELMDISKGVSGKFATYPISTTFNGDLAAKSGCEKHVKEVIEIYIPLEGDTDVIVNYVDEQRKSTSLYDSSKLEGSNQYEVFLGGDSSVIDIKTVSESTRRLLVVKDSFANSFLPFLTPYFREIVVVDPQYYGGTIDEIMDTYRITDTLILYSGNTFFQDNNISGVLNSEQ